MCERSSPNPFFQLGECIRTNVDKSLHPVRVCRYAAHDINEDLPDPTLSGQVRYVLCSVMTHHISDFRTVVAEPPHAIDGRTAG